MQKIEGTASFPSEAEAREAAAKLAELRHNESNDLVGGTADVRDVDVIFGYRVRIGSDRVASLKTAITKALAGGTVTYATPTTVEFDQEQFVDKETGEVRTQDSNRVLYVDGDGEEHVVVSKVRMVKAVDEVTGEEFGRVPVRSVLDAATGEAIVFEGDRGRPDPTVVVETA